MTCTRADRRCSRLRAGLFLLLIALLCLLPEPVSGLASERAGATGGSTVPAYRQANRVAVLTVDGVIDGVTLRSLERRIELARAEGADAVVLDINTPGGELSATLDICHLIKTDAPANTIAWINPQAYSAGTIIALATREIVVAPNATFGDAAPIQATPLGTVQLPAAERAKVEAPILEEVIDSARRNHYDENLVQAFISVGVELWLIEHRETGERIFVDREEYRTVFGEDPPRRMTRVGGPPSEDAPQRIVPFVEKFLPPTERDGESEEAGERELHHELPSTRSVLTAEDAGKYELVRQVISDDRLLTVRPEEAMYYGLATKVIRNEEELRAYFGAQELVRYNENWSEGLARFLMSWPVRGILIVIFLVCLFVELAAPGTGVFGTAALVALLLLIGAPAMMGMAQWLGILLIVIGLGLIALELFVIPGVGVAGVAGLISLMLGLIGSFVTGGFDSPEAQHQLLTGLATTITAVFAAGIAIWLISRQIKSIPVLEQLILKGELASPRLATAGATERGGEGRVSGEPGMLEAMAAPNRGIEIGDEGVAHTSLRPAGRGQFGDRIVDVQSPGGFIEQGAPIRVISVGRYVIDVEEANE